MRIDARKSLAGAVAVLALAGLWFAWLSPAGRGGAAEPASAGSAEGARKIEERFEPPPLADLQKVKWIPNRVADSLALLREKQGKLAAPVSDSEARALRNTGPEVNARLAPAMGRLPASDDEVDWDATLVRCLVGSPKSLNIMLSSTLYDMSVTSVLYAGAFTLDQDMNPLGDQDTVVEWSTSEDKMMDKVVLRRDLTWSDGAPFTAHDIEFSFHAIEDYDVPTPSARIHTRQLRGVKAYDDWTVVFFHKEVLATNHSDNNFPVVARHIFASTLQSDRTMVKSEDHARLNRSPVTSGPYKVVSWKQNEEIVCERRPEWYEKDGKRIRAKPYFKTIRFRIITDRNAAMLAFKKGELDEMELTPDQWQGQTGDESFYARGTKISGEEWSMIFIGWCQQPVPDAPFFKDRRAREALSYAFPYKEFLTGVCYGINQPAQGLFHPRSWWADPGQKPIQQDLRRAARLLDEAGWKGPGPDGLLYKEIEGVKVPFRFTLHIASGNPLYQKIGSLLSRDLDKLGVKCDVQEVEWTTLLSMLGSQKAQAFAMGWSTGADPDTSRNMWTTEALQEGRNYARYSNRKVDELFERGQRELDPGKRAEIYREIDRTITADFPFTFLYFRYSLYAISGDLRGMNFSPRGPYGYSPGVFGLWKKKR
jgi:peptide/nickel transport system substrate-binding protein